MILSGWSKSVNLEAWSVANTSIPCSAGESAPGRPDQKDQKGTKTKKGTHDQKPKNQKGDACIFTYHCDNTCVPFRPLFHSFRLFDPGDFAPAHRPFLRQKAIGGDSGPAHAETRAGRGAGRS